MNHLKTSKKGNHKPQECKHLTNLILMLMMSKMMQMMILIYRMAKNKNSVKNKEWNIITC